MKKYRILLLLYFAFPYLTFSQSYIELKPMPEPVSNNAVALGFENGIPHVYSFTGIGASKTHDAIHLKSFKYNTVNNEWTNLPDVPDPKGGKIAAAASTIRNQVYLIGGYHVAANGNEESSKKVHIFDPESGQWLDDGADLPVAIDDHVQAVWKDSLIFVITGWSDITNVPNVQIYNPFEDAWLTGTPVPNNGNYKAFGASGVIIGDTIYYIGGAKIGFNFPASKVLRIGIIDPDHPTDIVWEMSEEDLAIGYRCAATSLGSNPCWLGGSTTTYNFNGVAYNGTGAVSPADRKVWLEESDGMLKANLGKIPHVMDLRGVAKLNDSQVIIAGGIGRDTTTLNKTYLITLSDLVGLDPVDEFQVKVFPNPVNTMARINFNKKIHQLEIIDSNGRIMWKGINQQFYEVNVTTWPEGHYFGRIRSGQSVISFIVVH